MGNTSELITSNLSIQNRITDQREIWHRQVKPHPSIFVLNSEVSAKLNSGQANVWIENAHIPAGWRLHKNHALTNIPENNWNIELNEGTCLDLVPIDAQQVVIRNYGFNDPFRGTRSNESTLFMGTKLKVWLENHNLAEAFIHLDEDTDIQFLPLFPILKKENISETFLQWLIDYQPIPDPKFTDLWLHSQRVSADEIGQICNISEVDKQSTQHRINAIPAIARNYSIRYFYQLDLENLAVDYAKNDLELPDELQVKNNDWLPLHAHMFRAAVQRKRGIGHEQEEKKAFDYLRDSVLRHFHQNPVEPIINLLPDQIAWGRSPVRLDLAGGWSDTPPYCFLYGGKVLNLAVELNGQPPLHCYIKASEKPEFVLRSIDLGAQETITTYDELSEFYSVGSPFSIPKAALRPFRLYSGFFLPEISILAKTTC